jgi:hypothetical protein
LTACHNTATFYVCSLNGIKLSELQKLSCSFYRKFVWRSTFAYWSFFSHHLYVSGSTSCGSGSTQNDGSKEAKHYSSSIYHMCHRKSIIPHQSLFVTHHF